MSLKQIYPFIATLSFCLIGMALFTAYSSPAQASSNIKPEFGIPHVSKLVIAQLDKVTVGVRGDFKTYPVTFSMIRPGRNVKIATTHNSSTRYTVPDRANLLGVWKIKSCSHGRCTQSPSFEIKHDWCNNISGIQQTPGPSYTTVNGACYKDLCTNLEGYQDKIPEGYSAFGEVCVLKSEYPLPSA